MRKGLGMASIADNVKGLGGKIELVVLFVNFSGFNLECGYVGFELVVIGVHLDDVRV